MLKSTLSISLFISIIALLGGCIEQFDVETEREAGILIINGRVTNGIGPHFVTVTRTAAENRVSLPEGGGKVWLIDNQGNNFEFFQELPGRYTLPEDYASIFPGVSYKIRVELDDQIYESPITMMNDILAEDSIGYRFEDDLIINELGNEVTTRKYNVYLKSRSTFVDQKQYFKWEASEVFSIAPIFPDNPPCFLSNRLDPQRVVVGESVNGNELILNDVLVASRRLDDAFSIKHYTIVTQLNITETEYTYWKNVRTSIEQVGSIFDLPPATIRGNITNINNRDETVYGYFSVAAEKSVRYALQSEDIPGTIPLKCAGFVNLPTFCYCGDGIARPPYF